MPNQTLKAKIVSITDNESDSPMSSPDHTLIKLEGINCTTEQFVDMYNYTDTGKEFCETSGGAFIDLGFASRGMAEGDVLTVTFAEWFEGRFKHWERFVANERRCLTRDAMAAIDAMMPA